MQSATPPPPHSILRLSPGPGWDRHLKSPQACPAQGDCLWGGGEEEELLCMLSTVCRGRRLGGRAVSLSPAVPPASHGGWRFRLRYQRSHALVQCAVTPHWGSWCCVRSPNPRGGPLGTAAGLTPAGGPHAQPCSCGVVSLCLPLSPRGPIRKYSFLFGE